MDKLYNSIIELGKGQVGGGNIRFSIAIDSISRIFWLLHSDLHEARVTAVLEYLSSMVASLEPSHQLANGQRGHLENFSLIKHNSKKGKFHVRFKKRNGRYGNSLSLSLPVKIAAD
ncbi:hypothetical protein ES332_A09G000500v1 [Gossypium tomentosum]|uniref:Elongator complex protein 5 n=1 Tax=Gossypium tomentosum TaxID=34277 RepID=A0A5D2NWG6_GOSTO|nr:hypothetical protein ES332_A09G000500v1 [Gossypium tomentosum]